MKILVLCDGTTDPQTSLAYGIARARDEKGELATLHIIQRRPDHGRLAEPGLSGKALQKTLHILEQTRSWVHDHGGDIRTSSAFTIIRNHDDILRYARDTGVDLIVAPPAYRSLIDKACCLVDIISAEEAVTAA